MDVYDDRKDIRISLRGFDPVPWSAPHVSRCGGSQPNERLVAWQAEIARVARIAFGPLVPWHQPLVMTATFFIKRGIPNKKSIGRPAIPVFTWDEMYCIHRMKGKGPDLTNLIKAAEDALEDIVFVNDAQVYSHDGCTSHWSLDPGVDITIYR